MPCDRSGPVARTVLFKTVPALGCSRGRASSVASAPPRRAGAFPALTAPSRFRRPWPDGRAGPFRGRLARRRWPGRAVLVLPADTLVPLPVAVSRLVLSRRARRRPLAPADRQAFRQRGLLAERRVRSDRAPQDESRPRRGGGNDGGIGRDLRKAVPEEVPAGIPGIESGLHRGSGDREVEEARRCREGLEFPGHGVRHPLIGSLLVGPSLAGRLGSREHTLSFAIPAPACNACR